MLLLTHVNEESFLSLLRKLQISRDRDPTQKKVRCANLSGSLFTPNLFCVGSRSLLICSFLRSDRKLSSFTCVTRNIFLSLFRNLRISRERVRAPQKSGVKSKPDKIVFSISVFECPILQQISAWVVLNFVGSTLLKAAVASSLTAAQREKERSFFFSLLR